jgi:anti-sigma B factor antagonist
MAVTPVDEPERFALQDLVSDGHHRLLLSGELDLAAVPAMEACLRGLCAEGTTSIVLDLRKLTFMDSNGLRLMLLARQLCSEHGCELRLIQGPAQVRQVFEVTALLDHLPFSG